MPAQHAPRLQRHVGRVGDAAEQGGSDGCGGVLLGGVVLDGRALAKLRLVVRLVLVAVVGVHAVRHVRADQHRLAGALLERKRRGRICRDEGRPRPPSTRTDRLDDAADVHVEQRRVRALRTGAADLQPSHTPSHPATRLLVVEQHHEADVALGRHALRRAAGDQRLRV